MVGHLLEYHPGVRKLKELTDGGELGDRSRPNALAVHVECVEAVGSEQEEGRAGRPVQAGESLRLHLTGRHGAIARRPLEQRADHEEHRQPDEDCDRDLLGAVVHPTPDPLRAGRDVRVAVLGADTELRVVEVDHRKGFAGVGVARRAAPDVGGMLGPALTAPHAPSIALRRKVRADGVRNRDLMVCQLRYCRGDGGFADRRRRAGGPVTATGRTVHFGVTMFATDRVMRPDELARAAEERGFVSLYVPEHTHIPVSQRTPPPSGDAVLPDYYKRAFDPFVAMAMAAAATERLRVGTGICLVAQRDPIVTAKAVASLDHLSAGRFVFGVGFGWNADEIEDHGVEMRSRRNVAREHVLAMQRLWAEDVAYFEGEHVHLPPSWSWPKPTQKPWPPVLVGGAAGPTLFAHVAEYADGWIPIGGAGVREALPQLHRAADAAGRDPATVRVIPFGTIPDPGKLDYYASIGIDEVVLRVPAGDRDAVLPVLDYYTQLVEA